MRTCIRQGKKTISSTVLNVGLNQVNGVDFTATGGTFTLTVNGQTTGNVAYNASTGTLQTALEALSNVAPGDVTVSGAAGAYVLTWAAAFNGLAVAVSGSGANLTGVTGALAVSTTIQGGVPANARRVKLLCETQPIRYRLDGGTPDATTGFRMVANDEKDIESDPSLIRVVREGGSDATLQIAYFEQG